MTVTDASLEALVFIEKAFTKRMKIQSAIVRPKSRSASKVGPFLRARPSRALIRHIHSLNKKPLFHETTLSPSIQISVRRLLTRQTSGCDSRIFGFARISIRSTKRSQLVTINLAIRPMRFSKEEGGGGY